MYKVKPEGKALLNRLTQRLGKDCNIKCRQIKCTNFTKLTILNKDRFL